VAVTTGGVNVATASKLFDSGGGDPPESRCSRPPICCCRFSNNSFRSFLLSAVLTISDLEKNCPDMDGGDGVGDGDGEGVTGDGRGEEWAVTGMGDEWS